MGYLAFYSPLSSERVGERLLFTSLSFRRGTGRGFFGDMFRLFEIPLQTVRCYCSQINSLSSKTGSITSAISIGYKEGCKRRPFALQNMPFYTSKDALLHCKRASFTLQKGVDEKTKGKEIYKNNPRNAASPSPSEGGDVPGGIRNAGC